MTLTNAQIQRKFKQIDLEIDRLKAVRRNLEDRINYTSGLATPVSVNRAPTTSHDSLSGVTPSQHHAPVTVSDTSSIDLSLSGQDVSGVVLPAGVDHDALLNFVANEHIDHTTVSFTAGNGLDGGGNIATGGTFDIDVTDFLGYGLTETSNNIDLDLTITPTWTGSHTFQSDIQLDADLDFVGAQSITTTAGDLTITPTADLLLNPQGDDVVFSNWAASKSLSSDDYVSQTTGWGISYGSSGGHADFRSMYADEMHVQSFTADVNAALAGGLTITKSRARLSRVFTIPNTGSTATLYIEDLEGWDNTAVFVANDYVKLQVIDTSGGGLVVSNVYGQVTSYSDLSGGEQSWTFTTTTTGYSSAETVNAGSIAMSYGQTGSGSTGVWEATVLDAAGAPYSQVQTWDTVTGGEPSNFTTHVRLGNLDGISGVGLEYGLWAGQDTTSKYLLLSDTNFEVHGLDLSMYDGATQTVSIGADGNSWWGEDSTNKTFQLTTTGTDVGDVEIGDYSNSHGLLYDHSADQLLISGGIISGNGIGFVATDVSLYTPFNSRGYQVNTNGHLGQKPTTETAVNGPSIESPFNLGSLRVSQAATNYITNPVFESNTTGWTGYGGNTNYTRSSDQSLHAGYSCKITATGSGYSGIQGDFASGTALTGDVSLSLRYFILSQTNTIQFLLRIYYTDATNDSIGENVYIGTSLNEWHKLQLSLEINPLKTLSYIRVYAAYGSNVTHTVYLDDIQITNLDHHIPFFYYAMNGATGSDGSTSAISATDLRYAWSPNDDELTIMMWAYLEDNYSYGYLFDGGNATTDFDFFYRSDGTGAARIDGNSIAFSAAQLPQQTWLHITVTLNNGTATLYINDVSIGTTTYTSVDFLSTIKFVGSWNGYISNFTITKRAYAADEIAAIYASDAPITVRNSTHEFMAVGEDNAKVWLNENGLFATDNDSNPSFALINADGVSWNSETLNTRDVLLGDNSASKANILFDASEGKLNFRGGTTTQAYIDTDGSFVTGGGDVTLNTNGLRFATASTYEDTKSIQWYDETNSGYLAQINAVGQRASGMFPNVMYFKIHDPISSTYVTPLELQSKNTVVNYNLDVSSRTKTATLNISAIPTSSSGLSSGDVWSDSGTLKIV